MAFLASVWTHVTAWLGLGPGPDTTITTFWQELPLAISATDENGNQILALEQNQSWFDKPALGRKLFVRSCYKKLIQRVNEGWGNNLNFLIIGSEGIGKTMFLYYVMWMLVVNTPGDLHIIVELKQSDSAVRFYFSRTNGAYKAVVKGGSNSFEKQLADPRSFYLVDARVPMSANTGRRAKTLEVASPETSLYKHFEKEGRTKTLFMSIWSFAELSAARLRNFPDVTAAQLRENFRIVGGCIRYVLERQHLDSAFDAISVVEAAIGRCNIKRTIQTQEGSDVLLHYIVKDEDTCDSAYYDFASRYIVHQLQKANVNELEDYFESIIIRSKGRRGGLYFGVLPGRFFEVYAIKKLCEGGSFDVTKSDGARRVRKTLMLPSLSAVNDIVEIIDDAVDIPALPVNKIGTAANPNYPAIDALCTGGTAIGQANALFFQMKHVSPNSSVEKKIKIDDLTRLLAFIPVAQHPVKLIQVVPEMNFDSAQPFTYYAADGTVGAIPAGFEESVLSMPVGGVSHTQRKRQRRA